MSRSLSFSFSHGFGSLVVIVGIFMTATSAARSNPPASAQVGVAYQADFSVTGSPKSASSYAITGLPPGLIVVGATFSAGTNTYSLNRPFGTITGSPTTRGNFSLNVTAWEFANQSGSSRVYSFSIAVSPAPVVAPIITTQPVAQTVAAGSTVVFSVAASGTPAPAFQWQKDGVNIPGAIGNEYSIANCSSGDAGAYSVVASNAGGFASSIAVLLAVIIPPSNAVITIEVEP